MIDVSNNGRDFSNNQLTLTVSAPHIYSLLPSSGPVRGGTSVQLHGHNFINNSLLCIQFICNAQSILQNTPSTFIINPDFVLNSSYVFIKTPQVIVDSARQEVLCQVEISSNAQDFSKSNLKFRYYTDSVYDIHPVSGPFQGKFYFF